MSFEHTRSYFKEPAGTRIVGQMSERMSERMIVIDSLSTKEGTGLLTEMFVSNDNIWEIRPYGSKPEELKLEGSKYPLESESESKA